MGGLDPADCLADDTALEHWTVLRFAVLGGIARAVRFIGACEAMGVGFWCYSGDAGIATASYLHMSAALPWITEPSQSLFRWQIGDVIEVIRGTIVAGREKRILEREGRSESVARAIVRDVKRYGCLAKCCCKTTS